MADKKEKRTEIKEFGEFGLIDHLTGNFKKQNTSTVKGIGDDAAVIKQKDQLTVISTDLLIENIHFDLMYVPLKHLGYKSVVVNLSDIYAMNAVPKQLTFSIAISNRFSVEAIEELYEGIEVCCKKYGVDLIGGDTSSSPESMMISVTAIGEVSEKNIVYRDGAKKGDLICITGDLGAAYLGVQLLEREKQIFLENPEVQPDLESQDYVVGRQLKPDARKDVIELFRESHLVPTSMIDVSDGLSSDMRHICNQSKVGCQILEDQLPIHEDTFNLALKFRVDPTTCALNGGEDYELLFTVDKKDKQKVENNPFFSIIGEVTDPKKGSKLMTKGGNEHDLIAQGWNTFEKDEAD